MSLGQSSTQADHYAEVADALSRVTATDDVMGRALRLAYTYAIDAPRWQVDQAWHDLIQARAIEEMTT